MVTRLLDLTTSDLFAKDLVSYVNENIQKRPLNNHPASQM